MAAAFIFWLAPAALCETTYCAFEIRVADPSGTLLDNVPVNLVRNHDTRIASTTTDPTGKATFGDAPLGLLDVSVGHDSCGLVIVRDVNAAWPETRKVFVTYTKTYCGHFIFEDRCLTVLRIQNEARRPIAEAQFDSAGVGTTTSDALGRIFRSTERRGIVSGTITKSGFQPAFISEACIDDAEVPVVLHNQ